jgi:DNA-binding transcriptional regulator YiaG
LNRLAKGEVVPVELYTTDVDQMVAELGGLGVTACVIKRPTVDVRAIRDRLKLSQAEFAIRFGFELDTVQNWEQGRNVPDAPAQTLLKLIETRPEVVDEALSAS